MGWALIQSAWCPCKKGDLVTDTVMPCEDEDRDGVKLQAGKPPGAGGEAYDRFSPTALRGTQPRRHLVF